MCALFGLSFLWRFQCTKEYKMKILAIYCWIMSYHQTQPHIAQTGFLAHRSLVGASLKAPFKSWTRDLLPGLLTWLWALIITGNIKPLLRRLSIAQLTKWVYFRHNEAIGDVTGQGRRGNHDGTQTCGLSCDIPCLVLYLTSHTVQPTFQSQRVYKDTKTKRQDSWELSLRLSAAASVLCHGVPFYSHWESFSLSLGCSYRVPFNAFSLHFLEFIEIQSL